MRKRRKGESARSYILRCAVVNRGTVYRRIKKGWTLEDAMFTPAGQRIPLLKEPDWSACKRVRGLVAGLLLHTKRDLNYHDLEDIANDVLLEFAQEGVQENEPLWRQVYRKIGKHLKRLQVYYKTNRIISQFHNDAFKREWVH